MWDCARLSDTSKNHNEDNNDGNSQHQDCFWMIEFYPNCSMVFESHVENFLLVRVHPEHLCHRVRCHPTELQWAACNGELFCKLITTAPQQDYTESQLLKNVNKALWTLFQQCHRRGNSSKWPKQNAKTQSLRWSSCQCYGKGEARMEWVINEL